MATKANLYRLLPILTVALTVFLCHSCAFTKEVKNGETAYELKQYSVAIDMLSDEYRDESNTRKAARMAFLLGSSYEILNDIPHAIRWYEKAIRSEYGEAADRGLAKSYKKAGDYAGALSIWNRLKSQHPSDQMIKREIQVLKLASDWARDRQNTTKVFALDGNSKNNDYAAAIYEGNYLVFSSDRKNATGGESYKWTGKKYSDLFIMDKEGRGARRFDAEINTNDNEGAACFNSDFTKVIFTRCTGLATEDSYCKLMYSDKVDGLWTDPQMINFMEEGVNYGQPTLIENDSVLVYCSEGTDGPGGYDLYYSELVGDNEWSIPYPMPSTINTAGNEYFPSSSRDTLYFSSDYHPGLGGLDIFKTYLKEDGSWAQPVNLRQPINSSYDDFGLVIDEYANLRGREIAKGYFSSSRGERGNDNIYSYTSYIPEDIEIEIPVEDPDPEDDITLYLAGKVITDVYEDNEDPNSTITGEQNISDAQVLIEASESIEKRSDKDGRFIESLASNTDYTIKVSKPGYLSKTINLSTSIEDIEVTENSYTYNETIKLEKIFYGKEIILKEIYYEYEKWAIIEDAKPTLNRLTKILIDNPKIRIELSSHTDCRGEPDYNAELSQKRAQSAVLYLVDQGINFGRLQAQGYGESQLAIDCNCDDCTEEQHQENRRTSFKILK